MKKANALPFARMIHNKNRTPTGKRTATPAKKAAIYFAFGRDMQAKEAGQQRGEWIGPAGEPYSHADVLAWGREQSFQYEQTFQALLSVPEGWLTAGDYAEALRKAGQIPDFRLMTHDDTAHSHAHVLFFRDKRLQKEDFMRWHGRVQQELAALERKQLSGQEAVREQELSQPPVPEEEEKQITFGLG